MPRAATWDAVLEAALDCIIVMDSIGVVREFNPAAQITFGYTREQAVGKTLSTLIVPPELRPRHEEGLKRYLATGVGPVLNRRIEIEGVRSDGSRLPVELAIVPFVQEGQQLFAGYLRDLTPRRRAAALADLLHTIPLAAAQAPTLDDAVRTSLRSVCSFTAWPIGHAFRRDGDLLRSTGVWHGIDEPSHPFRTATEALRLHRGEGLPGRIWSTGAASWISDVASDADFPRRAVAQSQGLGAAFGLPVLVDGQVELVLEFFGTRRESPDADLLKALDLVGRELGRVVARLRQQEELHASNARLEELAESRRRFLSLAAHELGTPLSSLAIQMRLARRAADGSPLAPRLEVMQRNVDRLSALAHDLLDAARAEVNRIVVRPEPCDLARIASQSAASLHDMAADKSIELAVQATPAPLVGDPQRLGQVVDNLLSNAIRYTPEGGNVALRTWIDRSWAVLEVEDDGHGIDPGELPLLFQPFSQVHSGDVEGGTGLGLFITRGIVTAHGGSVDADSKGRGQGATFRVRLPVEGPPR